MPYSGSPSKYCVSPTTVKLSFSFLLLVCELLSERTCPLGNEFWLFLLATRSNSTSRLCFFSFFYRNFLQILKALHYIEFWSSSLLWKRVVVKPRKVVFWMLWCRCKYWSLGSFYLVPSLLNILRAVVECWTSLNCRWGGCSCAAMAVSRLTLWIFACLIGCLNWYFLSWSNFNNGTPLTVLNLSSSLLLIFINWWKSTSFELSYYPFSFFDPFGEPSPDSALPRWLPAFLTSTVIFGCILLVLGVFRLYSLNLEFKSSFSISSSFV